MSRIKRDPKEIDFSPSEELDNVQKIFLLLLDPKDGEPIPGKMEGFKRPKQRKLPKK